MSKSYITHIAANDDGDRGLCGIVWEQLVGPEFIEVLEGFIPFDPTYGELCQACCDTPEYKLMVLANV